MCSASECRADIPAAKKSVSGSSTQQLQPLRKSGTLPDKIPKKRVEDFAVPLSRKSQKSFGLHVRAWGTNVTALTASGA